MRKKPEATEKDIESEVLRFLNSHPEVFAFKVNTTGIYDPSRKCYRRICNPFIHKGTSDIIGLFKGRFFAFEVKRPSQLKNALREAELYNSDQGKFLQSVRYNGGVGAFISSVEDAKTHLALMCFN